MFLYRLDPFLPSQASSFLFFLGLALPVRIYGIQTRAQQHSNNTQHYSNNTQTVDTTLYSMCMPNRNHIYNTISNADVVKLS
jgi:hypothetical protein